MEKDLLEILVDLDYNGPLVKEQALKEALDAGHRDPEYTRLVAWLCQELGSLGGLDEVVNPVENAEDSSHFLLELSSFLTELQCPHRSLMEGPMNKRFADAKSRAVLIEFLATELEAARMIALTEQKSPKKGEVTVNESDTAAALKTILQSLGLSRPPENVTSAQIFGKAKTRLAEVLVKAPETMVGEPLFQSVLTDKQWHQLENLCAEMTKEYACRREMLLTRLDVTIQSFKWSEKLKEEAERVQEAYKQQRQYLKPVPDVCFADFLAARKDLAVMEKTSSAAFRRATKSHLNDVVIGAVPDRGGRPSEQQAPPPEMPSWQKQRASGPPGGGGDRGGRGSGRGGGKVQNFQQRDQHQQNWNQGDTGRGGGRGGWSGGTGGSRGGYNQGYGNGQSVGAGYNQNFGGYNQGFSNFEQYGGSGGNGSYGGGGYGGGARGRGRGRGRGAY